MESDNVLVSRSASDGQLIESSVLNENPQPDYDGEAATLPRSDRSRSRSSSRSRGSILKRTSLSNRVKRSSSSALQQNEGGTGNFVREEKKKKKLLKSASVASVFDKIFDFFLPDPKPKYTAFNGAAKQGADEKQLKKAAVNQSNGSDLLSSTDVSTGGHGKKYTAGVIGLKNHGNSCYMNAVIQCLSHTDLLAEYFVMDQYKVDLRRRSKRNAKKYGTKGEVTEQLARLLKALWSSQYTPDISDTFKRVVGDHKKEFKGSDQNDAQEFLIWLLDRVHEDLNTADKKKFKKNGSSRGKPSEVVAAESLANYQRSNISFVNEIFRAQFQSSVTCHNCQRLSITYDPFLCISVPIPQRQTRAVYCTVVYLDRSPKQVKMGLSVIAHGNIQDLREALAKETKIPEKRMIVTEIQDDNLGRTFATQQPISAIRDSDNVYVIETPKPMDPGQEEEHLLLLWINRLGAGTQAKRFGGPCATLVRRMSTYVDLQTVMLKEMKGLLRPQVLETVTEATVRLRVVDGFSGKCYLPDDVEHPLYMETVDEALVTTQGEGLGPHHLKLNVEWDQSDYDRLVEDVTDNVEDDPSVDAHRNEQNLPIKATLNECFELYLQAEELGADNQWKCPNCMKHEQCMKKISLWSVPDILVIHLMRFRQTSSQRTKLDTLVEFPITGLDMSSHIVHRAYQTDSVLHHNGLGILAWSPWKRNQRNYTRGGEEDNIYDLYGVCNHSGGLQSGHYTAVCKNPANGLWYSFDDQKVEEIEESSILTPSAYILFYQRRSMSSGCSSSDSTSSAGSEHWVHKLRPTHFHAKVSKSHDNLSALGKEEKEKVHNKTTLRGTRPYASMGALNAHKRQDERKVRIDIMEKAHYSDEEGADCYMMMPESSV